MRTYSSVAVAGFVGLLFDCRDGPVRTVQLFAYVMLFLGGLRLARIAALVSAADGSLKEGGRKGRGLSRRTKRLDGLSDEVQQAAIEHSFRSGA